MRTKKIRNGEKKSNQRDEAEFRIKKLYLYYVQMGRCMYSGEAIDLHALMAGNEQYDIDHIYPRHFVKDDSLENNLFWLRRQSMRIKAILFHWKQNCARNSMLSGEACWIVDLSHKISLIV